MLSHIKQRYSLFFVNSNRHVFPQKTHMVGKIKIDTSCDLTQTLDVQIITQNNEDFFNQH